MAEDEEVEVGRVAAPIGGQPIHVIRHWKVDARTPADAVEATSGKKAVGTHTRVHAFVCNEPKNAGCFGECHEALGALWTLGYRRV